MFEVESGCAGCAGVDELAERLEAALTRFERELADRGVLP
jgi:hypothetical protein